MILVKRLAPVLILLISFLFLQRFLDKKSLDTLNTLNVPPQAVVLEEKKLITLFQKNCIVYGELSNGTTQKIGALGYGIYDKDCLKRFNYRIAPSGKFAVYEDLSGGVDSMIQLFQVDGKITFTLGVYGTSSIIDMEFQNDDRLVFINGYPDSYDEQWITVVHIPALLKNPKIFDGTDNYLNTTGFEKTITLPNVRVNYSDIKMNGNNVELYSDTTYINRYYVDDLNNILLTDAVSTNDLEKVSEQVINIIKDRDFIQLSDYISKTAGVRLSPYTYVTKEDVVLSRLQIEKVLADKTVRQWGFYDGKGDPINLSFEDYYQKFIYNKDFANAPEVYINSLVTRGNTINNVNSYYRGASSVEYYFPGTDPNYGGMDWSSLKLVFNKEEGSWKLVGIVHDEWTI